MQSSLMNICYEWATFASTGCLGLCVTTSEKKYIFICNAYCLLPNFHKRMQNGKVTKRQMLQNDKCYIPAKLQNGNCKKRQWLKKTKLQNYIC